MAVVKRPLSLSAAPATQHLIARLDERLRLNRSAVVAPALAELARREGLTAPVSAGAQRPGGRRAPRRVIADPPGPIGGRRSRI